MKFKGLYTGTLFLIVSVLVSMLFINGSCNNNKGGSNEKGKSEKGMEPEKNEAHSGHDMKPQNGEGMAKSEHNMEDMIPKDSVSPGNSDRLKISSAMPSNYQVVSSQKSVKPVKNAGINEIVASGYIAIDERRNHKVFSRVSGRIEKLYVKYSMQYVKKGEKIMKIYSPELNTFQEELLFLMKGNNEPTLIAKAEEKLQLLGVSQNQINDVKKTGKAFFTIDIHSPLNAYVFFKSSSGSTTGSNNTSNSADNSSMGAMGTAYNEVKNIGSGKEQIREGNYVNKGDFLYGLNDLEFVWGMVAIDNIHQQELKEGVGVSLISELDKTDTIHTVINFIEPVYQQNQKFNLSRIYLKNPDKKYKINSLITVRIKSGNASSMMVPYSSVLFLGKRKIVWVLKEKTAGNNRIYEAREVFIGLMHNGLVEIKKGLHMNEEIAMDAGYLLDRESLIKPE